MIGVLMIGLWMVLGGVYFGHIWVDYHIYGMSMKRYKLFILACLGGPAIWVCYTIYGIYIIYKYTLAKPVNKFNNWLKN